ncbi:Uma2 family endonuclease [Dyadobacter sp. CY261]|uniref:Uma2 family endonuclease n=1 Tax=Dyadobacter sp. CY261 TaxID=2907203 RepID=UPI001F2FF899|nr:Uma2 family endonuclease [Dyadobacter sp. CY261]MCF0072369.1 Uma2 family endonuclease [Dyadobacter sp. CY261]
MMKVETAMAMEKIIHSPFEKIELTDKPFVYEIDLAGEQFGMEELYLLCQNNPDLRIEKDIHNTLTIMTPTFTKTGLINTELVVQLGIWNKRTKLGYVFDSSTGYQPAPGALYSPDVSWIEKHRWDKLSESAKTSFAPICPDFVIELKSTSDRLKKLELKMQDWIQLGVRLAWLIDPIKNQVRIFSPTASEIAIPLTSVVSGGEILPGFELDLRDIN